jgi:hypothetical protein
LFRKFTKRRRHCLQIMRDEDAAVALSNRENLKIRNGVELRGLGGAKVDAGMGSQDSTDNRCAKVVVCLEPNFHYLLWCRMPAPGAFQARLQIRGRRSAGAFGGGPLLFAGEEIRVDFGAVVEVEGDGTVDLGEGEGGKILVNAFG